MKDIIRMALKAGFKEHNGMIYATTINDDCAKELKAFADLVRADERNSWPAEMEAMERQVNILTDALAQAKADERERVCKAIKEEDDYCVTEGDYMLDSDDCIAVAKGEWVRPDYAVAIRARGETK